MAFDSTMRGTHTIGVEATRFNVFDVRLGWRKWADKHGVAHVLIHRHHRADHDQARLIERFRSRIRISPLASPARRGTAEFHS